MKKLMFPGTGFPGGIKTLKSLQENTMNVVHGLARQHENYTVLYGMEVNLGGTQISAGAFVYNGEIIPFLDSPTGTKITINEVIEQANFNTNPDNQTSIEALNAYSSKSAQTGTGGVHTFDTVQLKRLIKSKVFQLADFEFNSSGGFMRDITLEVDINIIKRAIDWDFSFIEIEDGDHSIRNLKQHSGSTISNAGFVNDAKLIYTTTNVRLLLNISNPTIHAPKLIIHYI